MEQSPEVFLVSAEMARTGVDFCLDVHGDEALPYNFIAGPEGIPSYTDALAQKLAHFQAALVAANPDFQTKYGYPPTPPGKANLRICANSRGRDLRLPRHDPGNAVQGRGERARSPRRLVASAQPPTRAEFLGGAHRSDRRGALS